MTRLSDSDISRRQVLKGFGASGAFALAGCTEGTDGDTATETVTPSVPPTQEGIDEWGQRLNDHAREAGIDWEMFADDDITLRFGMGVHPYFTTTDAVKDYFTELTGIDVEYESFSEDRFWLNAEEYLSNDQGRYDGIMVGLWPGGGYHWGDDGDTWVRDLNEFIENDTLTDRDWLHMEDFRQDTIDLMTFPDGEGGTDFIGFPNGIEAYGCPAIDKPTFETLGIDEPTTVNELRDAAKQISDSDEVDREGIVSRTSSTTLSSANWGTMFKTYGANWIDRENKEAALNSERGIASLEMFGEMMREYGAGDPTENASKDWYANNNTFDGEVGIMYSTPQTSGIISPEQGARTKFLPPVKGPDEYGNPDPVVDTWIWSTGISKFSENPEAAWLYIQWANSREANYMLSTRQWEGDQPRAGYARWNYIFDRVKNDPSTPNPPEGYENAFREGMANVPVNPPPVPVDTPENMDIMSEAASAMSSVVAGQQTAAEALNGVAPAVTGHAEEIPDRYIGFERSHGTATPTE
jgi:multiple sugar transport system substrate-binding protein